MQRSLSCAAPVIAAMLLTAGAPCGAVVTEEFIHKPYAVRAQPDESLRQAINAATPIAVDGRRFHGYTRWNVRWTFRWWREASGRCTITDVTTLLRVELQLPDLQRATPRQRAEFDRYLPALSEHEQGHVQFGREQRTPSIRALPSCLQRPNAPPWSAAPTHWATACCASMWSEKSCTTKAPAMAPHRGPS